MKKVCSHKGCSLPLLSLQSYPSVIRCSHKGCSLPLLSSRQHVPRQLARHTASRLPPSSSSVLPLHATSQPCQGRTSRIHRQPRRRSPPAPRTTHPAG